MAGWFAVPSPLDEVLEAFQALLDARRDTPVPSEAGRGNFRCERCVDCSHCRFCTDCTVCEDCTYCEGCDGCTSCTHCKQCYRCKQTTHSTWSSECSESSYLTLCLDCKTCVQCFACVGLQNEEFCILNEKLPRKAYFSRVAALRGALVPIRDHDRGALARTRFAVRRASHPLAPFPAYGRGGQGVRARHAGLRRRSRK